MERGNERQTTEPGDQSARGSNHAIDGGVRCAAVVKIIRDHADIQVRGNNPEQLTANFFAMAPSIDVAGIRIRQITGYGADRCVDPAGELGFHQRAAGGEA